MTNSKIRVLIVDDSAFMRKVIRQIIEEDTSIEVVGVARSGEEALRLAEERKPDVITLDVEMPVMDGFTCLQRLLAQGNYGVIMVSSLTTEGAYATIRALEIGAVDVFPKPTNLFNISQQGQKRELLDKIHIAGSVCKRYNYPGAGFNVKPRPPVPQAETESEQQSRPNRRENVDPKVSETARPTLGTPEPVGPGKAKKLQNSQQTALQQEPARDDRSGKANPRRFDANSPLIALGISTGGPRALQYVIPGLPATLPMPVLVVQHMPPGFTRSLAQRLNDISAVEVREAEDGDELRSGCVYVAPGNYHLDLVREGSRIRIRLDQSSPPVNGFRPSVDYLMDAVRRTGIKDCIGVIMTGMGSDGSRGIQELKRSNGAHIIAQDEDSCSVFGMPRATIELGVVDEVVPLENIAASIVRKAGV